METQFKSSQQQLAEMEQFGRTFRLVSSMFLATFTFFCLILIPLWVINFKMDKVYGGLEVATIAAGMLVIQILVLSCYRELKYDSSKYKQYLR